MFESVRSLAKLPFTQLMELYGPEENVDSFYRYLQDVFFRTPEARYCLWREGDQVVCALRIEPYLDGYLLNGLQTHPDHRGRGYATQLMGYVLCLSNKPVYSHIDPKNLPSVAVHKKYGFRKIKDTAVLLDGTVTSRMGTYIHACFTKTKQVLESLREQGRFDSYALLVRHGDRKTGIHSEHTNPDTCFEVASLTKVSVTAPLVLMAVREGKLRLDERLGDIFPGLTQMADATIFQLLTHSSGIGGVPFSFDLCDQGSFHVATKICQAQPHYQPGTDVEYSCMGFITLGAILEQRYGKKLDQLFEEKIVKPLGMEHSRFNIPLGEENTVVCYRRDFDRIYAVDDENAYFMRGVSGNAGAFWSMGDLEILADAIWNKTLYGSELADLAEQNYTEGMAQNRGLGYLMINENDPVSGGLFSEGSFGHCGYTGTSMFFDRKKGLYVVLLTNSARFAYREAPNHEHVRGRALEVRSSVHRAIKEDLGI